MPSVLTFVWVTSSPYVNEIIRGNICNYTTSSLFVMLTLVILSVFFLVQHKVPIPSPHGKVVYWEVGDVEYMPSIKILVVSIWAIDSDCQIFFIEAVKVK